MKEMANEKREKCDLEDDFNDANYKSCFARSVVVNSQHNKQLKTSEPRQLQTNDKESSHETFKRVTHAFSLGVEAVVEPVKLRKNHSMREDDRRLSSSSVCSSRRGSICSSRISEIPVENMAQQSKIDTLQWQLKEVEKSREMYRAVMKQVVTFLEKAHRSLELLGSRINNKPTVPRSKSEHQIVAGDSGANLLNSDEAAYRDFTWRRPKPPEPENEETPPEKLSQEAFRLLRTAQSLLSTQEPKLAPADTPDDLEFLAQLAREFPQSADPKPHRTTSFSVSPKLLTPEKDTRICMAFNRKLSLQLNETRRFSYKLSQQNSSPRSSLVDAPFMSSTVNDFEKAKKAEPEKSDSPPAGSVSSVEDESGFSSMNSFQDVGLPIVGEEVNAKNALLRSMLHNNVEYLSVRTVEASKNEAEENIKLWQKPDSVSHKRWSSTPVNCSTTKQTMNVLWV